MKRFSSVEWVFVAVASLSLFGVFGLTIERYDLFVIRYGVRDCGEQYWDNFKYYVQAVG